MSFEVAEEPLDQVRDAAVSLLNATRRHAIEESRFDWLYRGNPDGPAVFWSVRETGSADLAGFTVALPRRMMVDGALRSAWNCADFSMDPRYRTLGPAIKLRRAAREGVDAGRVDFLYAHPNPRMSVIHARVGHHPIGRMLRFAAPSACDRIWSAACHRRSSLVRSRPSPTRWSGCRRARRGTGKNTT